MKLDSSIAAIVTGGASGLGEGTARMLAGHGVKVALFDLNAERGEAIAKEIGGLFCLCDVTSEESVDAALEKARHKGIDVIEAAQECIACAQLMGTTQLALIHGKVLAPGKVTLTVKTAHMGFTEAVAAAVGASVRG